MFSLFRKFIMYHVDIMLNKMHSWLFIIVLKIITFEIKYWMDGLINTIIKQLHDI